MKLRNATENDIDEIMAVENQAFIEGIRETRETFLERIRCFSDGFFVMEDEDGSTAGYFCCEIWHDFPADNSCFTLGHSISAFLDTNGKCLYVSSVALNAAWKGKGLGKWLFQEAVKNVFEKYNNMEESVLLVNEKWTGAMNIYSKSSYIAYDRLKNFFVDKKDEEKNGFSDGILMKSTRKNILNAVSGSGR